MSVDQLAARVLATSGIEGVTFVGGEPFAQAWALAALARRIRRAGLSVMVYSGYTLAELTSGKLPSAKKLLRSSDLLMDGRFRSDLPTLKPWRGSDNQRLISLSDRYAHEVDAWNQPVGQMFEMRVRSDGTLEVLGIPPKGLAAHDGSLTGMSPSGRRKSGL
jgi:anaerobic ribonucleoside-triphosphate reductase activating protein